MMLVLSARFPSKADPIPPIPNANPKNKPDTIPIFPGINSWAYTNIAGNAEDNINPMGTINIPVQKILAYGSNKENGAVPKIENQITYLRPNLSPKGPPIIVPHATEKRNTNKYICEV
jgi:hypothetical protein